jgi:hypothetical protein
MGAGDYAAGDGPAGDDVTAAVGPPRAVTLPAAIQYDGATGDYPLDANGRYISLHPVSQRVALKLLLRQGSIASAPDVGSGFAAIGRGSSAAREDQARKIVKTTLKSDIDAGDIELVRVDVDTKTSAFATLVAVYFMNLRDTSAKGGAPERVPVQF